MINARQYIWRSCMNLAFEIFFPQSIKYKKIFFLIFFLIFLTTTLFNSIWLKLKIYNNLSDAIITLLITAMKK